MTDRIRIQRVAVLAALLFGAAGFLLSPAPASAAETVTVTVTASPTTVNRGGTVTVTETITNSFSFALLAPKAQLLSTPNTLTNYTSLVSCDAGPGGSCTTNGGGYEAIFGSDIAGNSSATATFTLSILPSAPGGAETLEGQLVATNFVTGPPVPGQTITITEPTTLTATPAIASLVPPHLYLLNLSATLSGPNGPLAGEPISFTAGSTALCQATTNASGTASCSGVPAALSVILAGGYTASFAGTTTYMPSSARAGLVG